MNNNDSFKALADPTRREILRLLKQNGELSAGDLASHFDMTRPSLSHHCSVLKGADLVQTKRLGQQIFYSLNRMAMKELRGEIVDLLNNS